MNDLGIIGEAPSITAAIRRAQAIAESDARVLIQGETGTGKEIFAKLIHQQSRRVKAPFVAINCAAVPSDLFESELFGHEAGAFTSAGRKRFGLCRSARGGTLFLDDVCELPLLAQAKLLRFLQEGQIRSVGADFTDRVDVRIISATNRPLAEMVAQGTFRPDLFYRLKMLELTLPPLRERPSDISLLTQYFLRDTGKQLSKEAMKALVSHSWPGNVRELQHTLAAAVALTSGPTIEEAGLDQSCWSKRAHDGLLGDLQEWLENKDPKPINLFQKIRDIEWLMLDHALDLAGSHQRTKVAAILGIGTSTLREKLRRSRKAEAMKYKGKVRDQRPSSEYASTLN